MAALLPAQSPDSRSSERSDQQTAKQLEVLGAQSRHLVDRINAVSNWFSCPDFADVSVQREPVECLEAPR